MVRKLVLGCIGAAFLAAAALGVFAFRLYPKPGPLAQETLVYIQGGSSARAVASQLQDSGVIDACGFYVFLAAVKATQARLQAGEYQLPAGVSIRQALDTLKSGRVYQRRITLPEGLTSAEIATLIAGADALDGNIDPMPPDGALLPETYNYVRGQTRQSLIERMQKSMDEATARLWSERDADLPLSTPADMVTLASIVEKETGVPTERARVAGVFVNRLRQGIPLQSDPTVIYALTQGRAPLGRALLSKDLSLASPYNTYKIPGLPPGPIANPGLDSLNAVAHPEKHDWIYFVADGSGGHAFAKTLKEHNKNVANWRKINR